MDEQEKQNTAGELPPGASRQAGELPPSFGDWSAAEGREGKRDRQATAALVVMVVSFVLAFAVFLTVLCLPERSPAEMPLSSETPALTDDSDHLPTVGEDVRESLTTAEIYELCSQSVCSILAETEGQKSVGTGFVLSENGYLATACHVIKNAERITVYLPNGSQYAAALVAGNEACDLAVLKIEAEGLKPLSFGESAALSAGDPVVAIGTPLSLEYAGSVDTGEVSYPNRTVRVYEQDGVTLTKKMTLIQTNVDVNPGNSGCPLFNVWGEVVGVVTMRLGTDTEGMAFAIPSDGAQLIFQALQNGQQPEESVLSRVTVSAPKLGVVGETAREGDVFGVRILRFASGEYHAMNVLKIGDLIVSVEDRATPSAEELARVIADYAPGDDIRLTVLRAGQTLTFLLKLGS